MVFPPPPVRPILRTMSFARLLAPLAAAALIFAIPALANDSEAEWALGGIALKSNGDISMDSEDLFISSAIVAVNYRYTNHSDEDREVVIAFPLPALPGAEGYPDWDDLEFVTTVDGAPVEYEVHDRAMVGTRDVTALVEAEGWPVHWYRDYTFAEQVQQLPEADKARLVERGLLAGELDGEVWRVAPAWQGQRHYLRVQTFPAGQTVRVSHRYKPIVGGSVGGMLYPNVRETVPEALAEYRDKWCIDDSFLHGIDRKLAAAPAGTMPVQSETWLGYVLSSGANWRGPIKRFRLVVDKGRPDNLVSFCMDGVRKISPTQFEVVKTDFEPERDLDILIVNTEMVPD